MKPSTLLRRILAGLLLPFLLFLSTACGRVANVTGTWDGLLHVYGVPDAQGKPEGKTFRIVVKIHDEGSGLSGTLASPDEGLSDVAADAVTFKDRVLSVNVPRLSETYKATLSADGTELRGSLNQGSTEFPLVLKRSAGS